MIYFIISLGICLIIMPFSSSQTTKDQKSHLQRVYQYFYYINYQSLYFYSQFIQEIWHISINKTKNDPRLFLKVFRSVFYIIRGSMNPDSKWKTSKLDYQFLCLLLTDTEPGVGVQAARPNPIFCVALWGYASFRARISFKEARSEMSSRGTHSPVANIFSVLYRLKMDFSKTRNSKCRKGHCKWTPNKANTSHNHCN